MIPLLLLQHPSSSDKKERSLDLPSTKKKKGNLKNTIKILIKISSNTTSLQSPASSASSSSSPSSSFPATLHKLSKEYYIRQQQLDLREEAERRFKRQHANKGMKFGKQLRKLSANSDWSDDYMAYKKLKKILTAIKKERTRRRSSAAVSLESAAAAVSSKNSSQQQKIQISDRTDFGFPPPTLPLQPQKQLPPPPPPPPPPSPPPHSSSEAIPIRDNQQKKNLQPRHIAQYHHSNNHSTVDFDNNNDNDDHLYTPTVVTSTIPDSRRKYFQSFSPSYPTTTSTDSNYTNLQLVSQTKEKINMAGFLLHPTFITSKKKNQNPSSTRFNRNNNNASATATAAASAASSSPVADSPPQTDLVARTNNTELLKNVSSYDQLAKIQDDLLQEENRSSQQESSEFFELLASELAKVNSRFVKTKAELEAKYQDLESKVYACPIFKSDYPPSSASPQEINTINDDILIHENSTSLEELSKQVRTLYVKLYSLKRFSSINYTGFTKILKKYDKMLVDDKCVDYVATVIVPLEFNREISKILDLIERLENLYLDMQISLRAALLKQNFKKNSEEVEGLIDASYQQLLRELEGKKKEASEREREREPTSR